MDYAPFVKKLEFPDGFTPPTELRYEDVVATAITRSHLQDDVAGINASIDLIRKTRGGRWPTEPVTEDYNYVDLVWHECEFREGDSFTYAVYNTEPRYLGCAYLYPMGRRAPLTEELASFDIDVSWSHRPRTSRATTRSSTKACRSGSRTSSPSGDPTTRTPRSRGRA